MGSKDDVKKGAVREADQIEPLRDDQWPNSERLNAEQCYRYLNEAQRTGWRKGACYENADKIKDGAPFVLHELKMKHIPDPPSAPNPDAIERYREQGPPFPPIVFGPNGHLLDGYHRLAAAHDGGFETIYAYLPESLEPDDLKAYRTD